MAIRKTLTVLGTQRIIDTNGLTAATVSSADSFQKRINGTGVTTNAILTVVTQTGNSKGHFVREIYDKNDNLVSSDNGNISNGTVTTTLSLTDSAASYTENNASSTILDNATFSTGKLVIKLFGKIDIMSTTVVMNGSTTVPAPLLGSIVGNGVCELTIPFTVTEDTVRDFPFTGNDDEEIETFNSATPAASISLGSLPDLDALDLTVENRNFESGPINMWSYAYANESFGETGSALMVSDGGLTPNNGLIHEQGGQMRLLASNNELSSIKAFSIKGKYRRPGTKNGAAITASDVLTSKSDLLFLNFAGSKEVNLRYEPQYSPNFSVQVAGWPVGVATIDTGIAASVDFIDFEFSQSTSGRFSFKINNIEQWAYDFGSAQSASEMRIVVSSRDRWSTDNSNRAKRPIIIDNLDVQIISGDYL